MRDRRRACRWLIGVLLALAGSAVAQALAEDPASALVAAHNTWRRAVGVPELRWSTSLATRAQAWADHLKRRNACDPDHSPDSDVGENLFWAGAVVTSRGARTVQEVTAAAVVDSWAAEREQYDDKKNRCARGKSCGHYTQVVWRGSREVGCGRAVCSDSSQIWVCKYAPAGNLAGKRPY